MKAKSREQYVREWNNHIGQLIHVALDAEIPIEEYEALRDQTRELIEKAADKVFPQGGAE